MSYSSFRSPSSIFTRGGFSRAEFLTAFVILVILAGIGFIPLQNYLAKSRLNRAVESAHVISTLLSQYATDNNGVYPVGEGTPAVGRSEGIARNLLENNYTPDATPFAIGDTKPYVTANADYSNIAGASISWDFTSGATATTGLTSTAPDDLPVVYTTGESVAYPTTSDAPQAQLLSGKGPLGDKGLIVAYKAANAVFIPAVPFSNVLTCPGFFPRAYKGSGPYTQIKP